MTRGIDDGFIHRVVRTLITAVEDRNWDDIEIATAVLGTELGITLPAPLKAKMQRTFAEQDADV